jgi:hypothetical protein
MVGLFATKLVTNIDTYVLQIQTMVNIMIESREGEGGRGIK